MCVVARGDGGVDVINIESELAETKSRSKGTQSRSKARVLSPDSDTSTENGTKKFHLDYTLSEGILLLCRAWHFQSLGRKGST